MDTVIVTNEQQIGIPAWVADFESFRRWLESEDFPEHGKVCFIRGKVWVDLSLEAFLSHNQLRTEIGAVLHTLMKQTKFGQFVSEGMRYVHPDTELSTEPDGMVISHAALRDGRVQLVGGKKGDQTQVVGSPDVVIEVVSQSSEAKDAEWAMCAYFDAGVTEYWVIDGRDEDDLRFDIFKRSKKEFTPARKQGGWVKSAVLERSFRLVLSDSGTPEFTLEVR